MKDTESNVGGMPKERTESVGVLVAVADVGGLRSRR